MSKNYSKLIAKSIIIAALGITTTLPALAENGKGMTWGFRADSFPTPANNAQARTFFVGCGGKKHNQAGWEQCNAYTGQTSCSVKRHILCVKTTGNLKRPPYAVTTTSHAMAKEFYAGWSPRKMKLGPKKFGTDLTSRAAGDNFCGTGWRMAEHHDSRWISGMSTSQHYGNSWNVANSRSGGWAFHARFQGNQNRINKLKTQRYWVAINNQTANCWNP